MKVYLLFSLDDNFVPELIGVYTSRRLARAHIIRDDDYIIEKHVDN